MNQRAKWAVVFASLSGVACVFACSSPTTNFGNPNALDRRTIPGDGGMDELICSANGPDARAPGDGGACSTSWSNDLYPQFGDDGAWKCSVAACHGKADGPKPDLSGKTSTEVLRQLRASTVKVGNLALPYIPAADAGTTMDSRTYTFLCNLRGDCGSKMPRPPGKDLESADLCKVSAWINCGAPEN